MWDIFISHAWEDKEAVARPLAEGLREAGLAVWYDEFALRLGDSLRRSIGRGLKESRYGLVILSPAFFRREWPQTELDGLAARELKGGKVILPVWHNVTHDDVLQFSAPLADKVAVPTRHGLDFVIQQVLAVAQPHSEAAPPASPAPQPARSAAVQLRREPKIVSPDEAQQEFGLDGYWRPRQSYCQNQYEKQNEIVIDHATGLMWQKSGSEKSLTYTEAITYINSLNWQQFAGHTGWRLPTVPELMSLLEPEEQSNGLYINPIFDNKQFFCWSADADSSGGNPWAVNFYGFVNADNPDFKRNVRGVRS